MFQNFGMSENVTTTRCRKPREDHQFNLLLGFCNVYQLNAPKFRMSENLTTAWCRNPKETQNYIQHQGLCSSPAKEKF
jgi:hypothetical protein